MNLERIERNATSFAFLAKTILGQPAIDLDAEDFALDDVDSVAADLDEQDLFGSDDEFEAPQIKEEVGPVGNNVLLPGLPFQGSGAWLLQPNELATPCIEREDTVSCARGHKVRQPVAIHVARHRLVVEVS